MSLMLVRMSGLSLRARLGDSLWPWHLALIGSLAAWYIHGFVDFFYEFTSASTAFWLLVGLAVSAWCSN